MNPLKFKRSHSQVGSGTLVYFRDGAVPQMPVLWPENVLFDNTDVQDSFHQAWDPVEAP